MASVFGYIWIQPVGPSDVSKIERDREEIITYCAANGLVFNDFRIDAGAPGAALERPVMKELVSMTGCTVIVTSLTSLGRRFHDLATVLSEFSNSGIRLIAIAEKVDTGRPEGMQLLKVFLKIPQIACWIRPTTDELPGKVFVRAREVLHNGGTCPFGYNLDEVTNQYVVNPLEAHVVQRIFRERAAGRSLRQIANDLTRDGIATKRGGRWQANTVKTIVENLFYTGDYQCQARIYENDHEPVISKELFLEVNSSREIMQLV